MRPGGLAGGLALALAAGIAVVGASGCCSATATKGCLTPEALRAHGERREGSALLAYLGDERSWVREEAARALGVMKASTARERLESVLRDERERPWVRASAAEALGALGEGSSVEVIGGVIAAPSTAPEVKLAAIRALCRLAAANSPADARAPLQAIQPLTADEDVLVAALAEESLASGCGGGAR